MQALNIPKFICWENREEYIIQVTQIYFHNNIWNEMDTTAKLPTVRCFHTRVKVGGNPQCGTRTAEEMHSATHNKPPGVGGWDNEISRVTTAEPRVCPPHKWIRNLISNEQRLGNPV